MNVLDLIGHVADISAVPIAIIGFGVTYNQVKKTRKAAEAAESAARNSQTAIGRSSLLGLIPQLQRVEEELDRAIRSGSEPVVASSLQSWRWQAGQVRGLLQVGKLASRELLVDIQDSVSAASQAQIELSGSGGDLNLATATKDVRDAIAKVTNELGAIATVQGIQAGGVDDAR
ncbi:hypothetical protein TPA0907_52920 [Micromonospora humidisoli]|uniref:hypothetical protein n=1 Tax=Micromonospora sp. AKA109 TaxID=2733865 RepID=UPI0022CBDB9A|nr:hypothetical protein [Micromonospora sp. AKA109]GHJ10925.1 hypothetical protein TPA0907_52920 [Micromonospora sp. AKA109]